MLFDVNRNVSFYNHEKIQSSYKLRRSKSFDVYHSKVYSKTHNCRYFKKIKQIRKFVTKNTKNAQEKQVNKLMCIEKTLNKK